MGEGKGQVLSKEEIGDLGAQMLTQLWRVTFQALIDTLGPEKTLGLLKTNFMTQGSAGALNMEKYLRQSGYQKCGGLTIWLAISDLVCQFNRRTNNPIEITSSGFRGGEVTSCPFEKDIPEACTVFCDLMTRGALNAILPGVEIVITGKLTLGAPCCSWDVIKDGKKLNCATDETIASFKRTQFTGEVLEYLFFAMMGEAWAITSNVAVEYFGAQESIELLKPYLRQSGISLGLDMKGKMNIIGSDARSIASIMEMCNDALHQKGHIVAASPEMVEKEITECPFSGGAHGIGADLLSIRSNAICEAINPEYEFVSLQRMCKGDRVCRWVVRKRQ